MNAPGKVLGVEEAGKLSSYVPKPKARSPHPTAALGVTAIENQDLATTELPLIPLLVCSVHEHCWLRDHGIWGKDDYLTHFWEVVDWEKVGRTWGGLFDSHYNLRTASTLPGRAHLA